MNKLTIIQDLSSDLSKHFSELKNNKNFRDLIFSEYVQNVQNDQRIIIEYKTRIGTFYDNIYTNDSNIAIDSVKNFINKTNITISILDHINYKFEIIPCYDKTSSTIRITVKNNENNENNENNKIDMINNGHELIFQNPYNFKKIKYTIYDDVIELLKNIKHQL